MRQVFEPFVCLNDTDAIRKYSEEQQPENVFDEVIPMHTIRIGYPVADFGKEEYKE